MVSMSASGFTRPSTCTTFGSSKQRTTCAMASQSRMLVRKALPRPSPLLAPFTRPAMSTNSTVAGMIFCGLKYCVSVDHPRVGHVHHAHVRVDGAERIVRSLGLLLLGQSVEEGGLADVRQPDDSCWT
jgi:hypothetical protein